MSAQIERFRQWTGVRHGRNYLYLEWLPEPEFLSDGTSTTEVAAGGCGILLRYTWSHEGTAHEGALLVTAHEGNATGAWVDSWHQSASLLQLTGTFTEEAGFNLRGSYPAPEGPDWGWRITLALAGSGALVMEMFNITPDGKESPAVHVEYRRG